ncbi:MAG TPA: efflux transporter outer membrane subunit, partial [Candidatus Competibacteraceae bacterium]|nr:efflux transporter outer membrane subunit [Candidatus Competibacteraceae bacterium]
MRRALPVLIGFMLAGGCAAVGPDYQPPEVKLPPRWASPLAGGTSNRPASLAGWWKTFNDSKLDSLIGRAEQSNLDLQLAGARILEARGQQREIATQIWPTVDTSASYTRERVSENGSLPLPPGTSPKFDLYDVGFDASWELDVFGGTRRAIEAANAQVAAAEYDRRDVLVSLLAEVARNYIEVRGFQQRLAIAHRNIQAQQEVLAITQDRYRAGLTSELDVQQATALLATTQSQLPLLETGLRQAIYRLGVLLGRPPGALLDELSSPGAIPAPPSQVPVGLPSELLRRRPDIQRAEREVAAATARIGVAVAELFPRFSLTGTAGFQSISAGDWLTGGSRFWSIGPTVQWRLFDAGRTRAAIDVERTRQDQALVSYQRTVLASLEEVENALTAYAREQTRRQTLAMAVQANR